MGHLRKSAGPAGPQGEPGEDGEDGAPGSAGATGATGAAGADGSVLLDTLTPSGANPEWVVPSGYARIDFQFHHVTVNADSAQMLMRFSTNDGSTYAVLVDFGGFSVSIGDGIPVAGITAGISYMSFVGPPGDSEPDPTFSGVLSLYFPAQNRAYVESRTMISGKTVCVQHARLGNTAAINKVKIEADGSNITGTIRIVGYRA